MNAPHLPHGLTDWLKATHAPAFLDVHQLRDIGYFDNSRGCDWARPGDVLVFQGGGNFGDIHGPFQAFREHVIASRHDCRIVVLPQSLHFEDPAAFERCRAVCNGHPDLHLCVRDEHSRRVALQLTPHVYLMPDKAPWPLEGASQGVLRLRRCKRDALAVHARLGGLKQAVAQWFTHWRVRRAERFARRAIDPLSPDGEGPQSDLHAHLLSHPFSMPQRIDDSRRTAATEARA